MPDIQKARQKQSDRQTDRHTNISDTVLACSVASFKCRLNAYDFSKYLKGWL